VLAAVQTVRVLADDFQLLAQLHYFALESGLVFLAFFSFSSQLASQRFRLFLPDILLTFHGTQCALEPQLLVISNYLRLTGSLALSTALLDSLIGFLELFIVILKFGILLV
jgi:hypothetical protein